MVMEMCEFDRKSGDTRIDLCMRKKIKEMNDMKIKTVACCCGHDKYFPTIVAKYGDVYLEFITGTKIPRIRRFYKRDEEGIYFIPECV